MQNCWNSSAITKYFSLFLENSSAFPASRDAEICCTENQSPKIPRCFKRVFLKPTGQEKYYSRWVTERRWFNANKTTWVDQVKSREKKRFPKRHSWLLSKEKFCPNWVVCAGSVCSKGLNNRGSLFSLTPANVELMALPLQGSLMPITSWECRG